MKPKKNFVDHNKLAETDLNEGAIPMFPAAASLTWRPSEQRAELRVDFTAYQEALSAVAVQIVNPADFVMLLAGLNARDLGFNFMYTDLSASQNITHDTSGEGPTEILYYIHTGGTCGYDGGCSNGSPFQEEFSYFRITAVPATMQIKLWRLQPTNAASPHDFAFTMIFE